VCSTVGVDARKGLWATQSGSTFFSEGDPHRLGPGKMTMMSGEKAIGTKDVGRGMDGTIRHDYGCPDYEGKKTLGDQVTSADTKPGLKKNDSAYNLLS